MTQHRNGPRPFGVLGVFLVLLGAGLVLDVDATWTGFTLVAIGGACLIAEGRQASRR